MNGNGKTGVSDTSGLILNSPVARALAIIGDRWAHLILRDAFLGVRRFEEFRRRTGAARGTLASRLKSLVGNGILRRSVYQEAPLRHEYRLTKKGLDLYPMVLAAWAWEVRWDSENRLPPVLTHSRCGQQMHPLFRCRQCQSPISIWDVSYRAGTSTSKAEKVPARFQRRSRGMGSSWSRRCFSASIVMTTSHRRWGLRPISCPTA
jgi:DNA-binding HxlR family transcriptional regulator